MACVMQVKLGAQGFQKFPSDHTTHELKFLKRNLPKTKAGFTEALTVQLE